MNEMTSLKQQIELLKKENAEIKMALKELFTGQ